MEIETIRLYQKVAQKIKDTLIEGKYPIGSKLPPERDIATIYNISRSVVREAIIMLEIENLVEVKKGSGIYVIGLPNSKNETIHTFNSDVGPFELLQARQLLESNIAALAALNITKNDLTQLKMVLENEKESLKNDEKNHQEDALFHHLIAKATQNSLLEEMQQNLWNKRESSPMWKKLHSHITDYSYRKYWLKDHQTILMNLQKRDAKGAYLSTWQHLENVKNVLMKLSNPEDPDFDGFLFDSSPLIHEN